MAGLIQKVKMNKRLMLIVTLVLLPFAVQSSPSRQNTRTENILKNHLKALGGESAVRSIKSSICTSEVIIMPPGMKGTIKQWLLKPCLYRSEVSLGLFAITQGYDGERSWTLDQNNKVIFNKDISSEKKQITLCIIDDYKYLFNEEGFTIKFSGIDTSSSGRPCDILSLEPTGGYPCKIYLDKETNLSEQSFGGGVGFGTSIGENPDAGMLNNIVWNNQADNGSQIALLGGLLSLHIYYNDVQNVKVKATLPENVKLTGNIFPEEETEKLFIDSESQEIIWHIGELKTGHGILTSTDNEALNVAFQIAFTPDSSQRNQIPEIIGQAKVEGEDMWTKEILTETAININTTLPDDPTVTAEMGKIQ